ncbi:polysaccharide pyruvyl transferase family protein [Acetobacteraceae bacterium H6797]|nr:polysaccharide pyruvyl transferase family protein [Acetobacteraceae bacterium H6797]
MGWAGATEKQDYLNFGDALSPVMVAAMCGMPIVRRPMKSDNIRMACVGTIGHGFEGGEVHFWGTGMSPWSNPSAKPPTPWAPPADTKLVVHATRGPLTAARLGEDLTKRAVPYGDPVFLLPRFFSKPVKQDVELGVIIHLSEMESRALDTGPAPNLVRYRIPEALAGKVRIINTLTAISTEGLEDKIQEIRRCKRIVSTSLHGMVIAECYGIPCLYFSPNMGTGVVTIGTDGNDTLDLRLADLYAGIGRKKITAFSTPRAQETDWEGLIEAIDKYWEPVTNSFDDLAEAFPVSGTPLSTNSLFDEPSVKAITFQHSVRAVHLDDSRAGKERAALS